MKAQGKEIIVAVATKTLDGTVWVATKPKRHHDVLRLMCNAGLSIEECATGKQGFLTNYGRFLSRLQALPVALRAKQTDGFAYDGGRLYSEDLW